MTHTRQAYRDGLTGVAPLLVGVAPFGRAFGVAAAQSQIGGALGYATSIIIFGGAAQMATVQLFDAGAASAVIIATALVINARHFMYSAALAPHFREFPAMWRYAAPYLMTDQAFAVSITRYETVTDPAYKRRYYIGAGLGLWLTWQMTTALGAIAGAGVPDSWSLDFAIPLVFLALLIPAVKDRPGLIAAIVGGVVALGGASIPYSLGLIIGALSGIAAGVIAERMTS